jgi:hypothetical protein
MNDQDEDCRVVAKDVFSVLVGAHWGDTRPRVHAIPIRTGGS